MKGRNYKTMKNMAAVAAIVFVVMLAPTFLIANEIASIRIGGTELRLGMKEDATMAVLAEHYSLERLHGLDKTTNASEWLVKAKSGTPPTYYDTVYFKSGQLASIHKNWSPQDQQKNYELGRAIYRLLRTFEKEGNSLCTIDTAEGGNPEAEMKRAALICGKKRIEVLLSDIGGSRNVSLNEILAE